MVTGETQAAYDNVAQSNALASLRAIERMMEANPGTNAETRAHRQNILYKIRRGLRDEA